VSEECRRKILVKHTGSESDMTLHGVVNMFIDEPFRPEALRLIVFFRIFRDTPMVIGYYCASRQAISFENVVLYERMRDASLSYTRSDGCY